MATQDEVVRPKEVNHLKREHLGAVVAHVFERNQQSDPPKGDGLLAWNHSVE
jgi:hypothetical protein